MSTVAFSDLSVPAQWQGGFLQVLPAVLNHARGGFAVLNTHDREEATAEAVANACVGYVSAAARGRLVHCHPASLATYAVRAVRSARHVGGRQSSRDIMSRLAQKRRGLTVRSITPAARQGWRQMVLEDRRVSPADQAAFNLDFQQWRGGFAHRQRRIIDCLASGDTTGTVADRFGLTPARISQLRRQFERSWTKFQGIAA
jgi:DNA-binding NarL/FixJ family response regulator